MSDSERSLAILRQLHEMGVRISVDDFGTGYSSLAYLKQLPVDEIKVDRSFVSGTTRNGTVIIRSVVDLGRNLGLEVTAEGVENYETWELLSRMGCDLAQGYYLSRPLPADEVVPWIAAYDRKMRSQSRQRGRQSTILVVDDNPVYQQLLQALLSEEGYSVMLTESAEEALRLLHTARPHLILADVQLAGMSGLELARQIKANPTLQETVMVVMTGAPRPEDEQYARSIGCDHYIAKPNTNAELLALVRRSLAA
jgi:CheY-like chemotaxis protein